MSKNLTGHSCGLTSLYSLKKRFSQLLIAIGLFSHLCHASDPLDSWTWRNPHPTGNHLSSVTFGNGVFVAVGDSTIITSSDGVFWIQSYFGEKKAFSAVAYGNQTFVAIGRHADPTHAFPILISKDGFHWTTYNWLPASFSSGGLNAITYAAGRFVIAGFHDRHAITLTSIDGTHWIESNIDFVDSGLNRSVTSIAYGNGLFVAMCSDANLNGSSLTSMNGDSWVRSQFETQFRFEGMIYANGRFVAVGVYRNDKGQFLGTAFSSLDGINWVKVYDGPEYLNSVAHGNGRFVAVGQRNTALISSDGVNWTRSENTPRSFGGNDSFNGIAFAKDHFVAVGVTGVDFYRYVGSVVTSKDGYSWTRTNSGTVWNLESIGFNGSSFLITGFTNLTSFDGTIWTVHGRDLPGNAHFACGNGRYVAAVGFGGQYQSGGQLYTSTNWTSWTQTTERGFFQDITFGNGRFAAVDTRHDDSSGGTSIHISSDGITWNTNPAEKSVRISGIAYGAGRFVGVGWSNPRVTSVYSSLDAQTWNSGDLLVTNGYLWKVVYGGNRFVAVGVQYLAGGSRPAVVTSSEGIIWRQINIQEIGIGGLLNLCFGDDRFVAIGEYGQILSSSDGTSWLKHYTGTDVSLRDVSYSQDGFVAVGDYGTILQSGKLLRETPSPPSITLSPLSQVINAGADSSFAVLVTGSKPLAYQWRKNGINIIHATSESLIFKAQSISDSGEYSVKVSNAYGSAESQPGILAVLGDPTDGVQPPNPASSYNSVPSRPTAKDSLIIVTHGWQPLRNSSELSWLDAMTNAISRSVSLNWQVQAYRWQTDARPFPDDAIRHGARHGVALGKQLASQDWNHIHLIAHSAGSALIQAAAEIIKSVSPETVIHTTFLDPYVGLNGAGRTFYGNGADWSDNYFSKDISDNLILPSLTEGSLTHSYNVDVTWLDPKKRVHPVYCSSQSSTPATLTPCDHRAISSHSWPYDYYLGTMNSDRLNQPEGFGFPLSKEGGNWKYAITRYAQPNSVPHVLGGSHSSLSSAIPLTLNSRVPLTGVPSSFQGPVQVTPFGFSATATNTSDIPIRIQSLNTLYGTPAAVWLSLGVTVTNKVNLVTFDSQFVRSSDGAGLLTVYWNTNQIGIIDEKACPSGVMNSSLLLPTAVSGGNYVLGFRFDSFATKASTVSVTNITFGFAGITNEMALHIKRDGAGRTLMEFDGPINYNFPLFVSTNLIDWSTEAILVNTNGTVHFADLSASNAPSRFYRIGSP